MRLDTCVPEKLPLRHLKWESFADLIGPAHEALARYDEMLKQIPDSLAILDAWESLASLHTPKMKVRLQEVFEYERAPEIETKNERDLRKILNYRNALVRSRKSVKDQSISLTLLRKTHGWIREGAPGPKRDNGHFRNRQNWIGPEGRGIEEAYFYPPRVALLKSNMDNLAKYMRGKERDPLVQIAIAFAQLLVIHPFMDGNGRVGRAFIPLFLYKKGILSKPVFYMSYYFKSHRLRYFEKLFTISQKDDWEDWIRFFLKGVISQSEKLYAMAQLMLELQKELSEPVAKALFRAPVFTEKEFRALTSFSERKTKECSLDSKTKKNDQNKRLRETRAYLRLYQAV